MTQDMETIRDKARWLGAKLLGLRDEYIAIEDERDMLRRLANDLIAQLDSAAEFICKNHCRATKGEHVGPGCVVSEMLLESARRKVRSCG